MALSRLRIIPWKIGQVGFRMAFDVGNPADTDSQQECYQRLGVPLYC